ncbi:uncharacterized protein PHACADRAFT_214829 [Phanerochaete carnosa HHB-10118-sp]|uniref:Uncharacterized protein n=1 Tax=Phanerochaete carnosa (strain HHB-10118-sp) TaxID=650164 RepID=K5WE05_PHACS|nr:uncharacterized protein PHACADRAFT_214829 [Phanerochaete carnosa HHB-10118-sp]EKM48377.1 hypothetical protein PHACADRAFT_214829 [Phanerochaete carnosa HHB-10118-sp]
MSQSGYPSAMRSVLPPAQRTGEGPASPRDESAVCSGTRTHAARPDDGTNYPARSANFDRQGSHVSYHETTDGRAAQDGLLQRQTAANSHLQTGRVHTDRGAPDAGDHHRSRMGRAYTAPESDRRHAGTQGLPEAYGSRHPRPEANVYPVRRTTDHELNAVPAAASRHGSQPEPRMGEERRREDGHHQYVPPAQSNIDSHHISGYGQPSSIDSNNARKRTSVSTSAVPAHSSRPETSRDEEHRREGRRRDAPPGQGNPSSGNAPGYSQSPPASDYYSKKRASEASPTQQSSHFQAGARPPLEPYAAGKAGIYAPPASSGHAQFVPQSSAISTSVARQNDYEGHHRPDDQARYAAEPQGRPLAPSAVPPSQQSRRTVSQEPTVDQLRSRNKSRTYDNQGGATKEPGPTGGSHAYYSPDAALPSGEGHHRPDYQARYAAQPQGMPLAPSAVPPSQQSRRAVPQEPTVDQLRSRNKTRTYANQGGATKEPGPAGGSHAYYSPDAALPSGSPGDLRPAQGAAQHRTASGGSMDTHNQRSERAMGSHAHVEHHQMANNFTTGGKHTENQNHQNQHQSRPGEIRRTPSAEQAPSSYLQGNLDPRGFSGPSLSPVPENRQSRAPSRLQISTTPTPSNPQSGQPRGNTMTQGSSSHHDRRRESGESESRNPRQEPPTEAPLPKRRRSSAHRRDPSHTHSPGSAYPPEPEHTTCHPRRSDKSSTSADRDYFPHTYTSK